MYYKGMICINVENVEKNLIMDKNWVDIKLIAMEKMIYKKLEIQGKIFLGLKK